MAARLLGSAVLGSVLATILPTLSHVFHFHDFMSPDAAAAYDLEPRGPNLKLLGLMTLGAFSGLVAFGNRFSDK
jgi:hypothetical protein